MSKFYQHINPTDSMFDTITELDYIDDTDPSFELYYFKDGTKCNPAYIGRLNDPTAFDKQMEVAEISSPQNKWEFDAAFIEAKQTYAKDANGEEVLINDPYVGQQAPKAKIVVKSAPYKATLLNEHVRRLSEEQAALDQEKFNFDAQKEDEAPVEQASCPKPKQETIQPAPEIVHPVQKISTPYLANLDNSDEKIAFKYNDKVKLMTADEIIDKLFKLQPVSNSQSACELDMKTTAEQKNLLESMFAMAKKDACEISMNIKLNIPSESLYKLIANDYQAGLADAFVKMIANKISVGDLRHWVAAGLNAYYKGDIEIEDEEEIEPEEVEEVVPEVKVKTRKSSKKQNK